MRSSRKVALCLTLLFAVQLLVEAQYYNDYGAYNRHYPYNSNYQRRYSNSYGPSYGSATASYYPSYGYGYSQRYGSYYGSGAYSNYETYLQRKLRNALFSWGRTGCTGLVCV